MKKKNLTAVIVKKELPFAKKGDIVYVGSPITNTSLIQVWSDKEGGIFLAEFLITKSIEKGEWFSL